MGKTIYVDTLIDLEYCPENLNKLLSLGTTLGWEYIEDIKGLITTDEAYNLIIEKMLNEDLNRYLNIRVQDFYDWPFSLSFIKGNNNKIKVSFVNFDYHTKKPFHYDYLGIDFVPFIHFMLQLVKPFNLISIEADWF